MLESERKQLRGEDRNRVSRNYSASCVRESSKSIKSSKFSRKGSQSIEYDAIEPLSQGQNSNPLKRKCQVLYQDEQIKQEYSDIFYSVKTDDPQPRDQTQFSQFEQTQGPEFFQNFMKFYDQAVEIKKDRIRFKYMKDLFNLDLIEFPSDEEVFEIQQQILASSQAGNQKLKKNWTEEDKKVLVWVIGKLAAIKTIDFKSINENDWIQIASMINRRDSFQCKQKWLQMLKMPLQQAPWTISEDETLKKLIKKFQEENRGNKWSAIATELNRQLSSNIHRNGKQCRERWNNYLNPSINRQPWNIAEDLDLLNLSLSNGKRWALISKKLKVQRSENAVKNRFNCLLKKERNQINKFEGNYVDEQSSFGQENPGSSLEEQELSIDDVHIVNSLIAKLEWRIKQEQSGKMQQEVINIKEDIPKIKVENESSQQQQGNCYKKRGSLDYLDHNIIQRNMQHLAEGLENLNLDQKKNINEIAQDGQSQVSQVHTFYQERVEQITLEDILNSVPSLVNPKKGTIFFLTSDQMFEALQMQQQQPKYQNQLSSEILEIDQQQQQPRFEYPQFQSRLPLITSLGTIEEFSPNQPSAPSIGRFLNSENLIQLVQSQKKIQEEQEQKGKQSTNLIVDSMKNTNENPYQNINTQRNEDLDQYGKTEAQINIDQNIFQRNVVQSVMNNLGYTIPYYQPLMGQYNWMPFQRMMKPMAFQNPLLEMKSMNQVYPYRSDQILPSLQSLPFQKISAPTLVSDKMRQRKSFQISSLANFQE